MYIISMDLNMIHSFRVPNGRKRATDGHWLPTHTKRKKKVRKVGDGDKLMMNSERRRR